MGGILGHLRRVSVSIPCACDLRPSKTTVKTPNTHAFAGVPRAGRTPEREREREERSESDIYTRA